MKKNNFRKFYFLIVVVFVLYSCKKDDSPVTDDQDNVQIFSPVDVVKSNAVKIYAHYMPWFETPETNNGTWGAHWTMATQNPNNTDGTGQREIASHYYPLIGPYASGDKDIIEYHLLLMKYSGIDGIIFDWYGSFDVNDYKNILDNTENVIAEIDKAGLGFSIMYEDRTVPLVVGAGQSDNNVSVVQSDMQYIESNYFTNNRYISINSKPLLLVFGPLEIEDASDWTTIFSAFTSIPQFLTLWYEHDEAGSNCTGEYSWIYQDSSPYTSHLQNFYTGRTNYGIKIGSAFPGFNTFYEEGGWGSSEFNINVNTTTLQSTLDIAQSNNVQYLQLATWNDFGEGTMIEPTVEFGYTFLEKIQSFTGVTYTKAELEYINELYKLRKLTSENTSVQKALDQVFNYFVSLQVDKATTVIDSLKTIYF